MPLIEVSKVQVGCCLCYCCLSNNHNYYDNDDAAENCSSVNVVVDSVISAIEIIRCTKCQVQITGTAAAVTIDSSQGINVGPPNQP